MSQLILQFMEVKKIENMEITRKIYSKIIFSIRDKKMTQKKVSEIIGMKPQTFSDNLTKLKDGKFPSVETLKKLQDALEIDLGIKFF